MLLNTRIHQRFTLAIAIVSSYGESELVVESYLAGRFRVLGLHADTALFPRLIFKVGCALNDIGGRTSSEVQGAPSRYDLVELEGEVRMGAENLLLGPLQRTGARQVIESGMPGHERQINLACDLDQFRLERLESIRSGAVLRLRVSLWPQLQRRMSGGHELIRDVRIDSLSATIPRDDWVALLEKLRGDRYEIVEIRLGATTSDAMMEALSHLTSARRLLDEGRYDQAVAECRKAFEPLERALGVRRDGPTWRATLQRWLKEDIAEQYGGIATRVKQLTNYTHHTSRSGPPNYPRAEAAMILRTTESLVALVGDLSHRPERNVGPASEAFSDPSSTL